jgi:hypothetical protein
LSASFENWFIVFVVVMTVAVLTQTTILALMFLAIRETKDKMAAMQNKLDGMLDRDVQPLLVETRSLVADGRKTIATLQSTTEEIAQFAHNQTGRLDGLFSEAVERARLQLLRADDIFAQALSRVEVTAEDVHKTISQPLREIQAVLAGVRTAFEFLGGRRRPRGPVDRSTQDEEMFI